MKTGIITIALFFRWITFNPSCGDAATVDLISPPSGVTTISEVDGRGSVSVLLSEAVFASPVTVTCRSLETGNGVTSVKFENATIPIAESGANINFSVISAGRAVSVQCTGQSRNGSQYTLDASKGNTSLLQVTRFPTVSLCRDTVYVASESSSGTVQVQFSEQITRFPVVVKCTSKEPLTGDTKNQLQLTFTQTVAEVNQNKVQVRYTVLQHGSPVLVACSGQTYNVTYLPVPTLASSMNSSVISERPFNISLINVDRLQYLYNKSEGNSAIFATDKPSLSLFPPKPVFMVNGTYQTLLVLDAPAPGTVPVVCSLERVSISRININTSRLCEGSKGGPTVVNNEVAFSGVRLQLKPQELEYKKGQFLKTIDITLKGYPSSPVNELARISCCVTDTSTARYRTQHAMAYAMVKVLRYRNISWDSISAGQIQTTSSTDVNLACPCNLKEDQCDASCCCDKECSTEELKSFTCLIGLQGGDKEGRPFEFSCQATWPDSKDWQPFLCVVNNNSPFTGYFYNFTSPTRADNSQSFSSLALKRKSGDFSYLETENRVTSTTSGTYTVGSVVRTADRVRNNDYATAGYGTLTLPQSVVSGFCSQTVPVLYLEDVESKCVQQINEDSCSSFSSLSAQNYLVSRKVTHPPCPSPSQVLKDGSLSGVQGIAPSLAETEVKYFCVDNSSAYVSNSGNEEDSAGYGTSLFPSNLTKQSSVVKRCEFDDSLTAPPTPRFDNSTQTCSNVVLSVKYKLEWSGQQIVRVSADVTLGDIVLRQAIQNSGERVVVLTQNFEATFLYRSNDSSVVSVKRSGNPGYQQGSLVLTNPGILALWSAGSDSLCTGTTTTSVTYGTDAISGCLLRLSLDDMRNCSGLRDLVQSNQNKLIQATMVGRTGNANAEIQEDWVPVIRDAFKTSSNESSNQTVGICTDIPATLRIEMLVTEAGKYRGVSQMEIVGTRISYGYTTWQFECTSGYGVSCLGNQTVNSLSSGNFTSNGTSNSSIPRSSTNTNTYQSHLEYFQVTSSVVFFKVPSKDPPRVKRSVDQSGVCYQERCKEELFYPLTAAYQGQPPEQVLALSLALLLIATATFAVTRPWG